MRNCHSLHLTFCGTLPGNQSTLTSFHASRFCVAPIIYSAEPVEILGVEPSSTIDGGGAGYCPRVLSVFQFVSTTDTLIYHRMIHMSILKIRVTALFSKACCPFVNLFFGESRVLKILYPPLIPTTFFLRWFAHRTHT